MCFVKHLPGEQSCNKGNPLNHHHSNPWNKHQKNMNRTKPCTENTIYPANNSTVELRMYTSKHTAQTQSKKINMIKPLPKPLPSSSEPTPKKIKETKYTSKVLTPSSEPLPSPPRKRLKKERQEGGIRTLHSSLPWTKDPKIFSPLDRSIRVVVGCRWMLFCCAEK